MTDLAITDNVKSGVTDPRRRKDFLDPTEIKTFLDAAKAGRQGARDHLLFLMMFRHGLRCSEAVDLRIDDVSFDRATLWVRRLKGSNAGMHPIEGDELRAIRRYRGLRKDSLPWLFLSERQGRANSVCSELPCQSYRRSSWLLGPTPSLPSSFLRLRISRPWR